MVLFYHPVSPYSRKVYVAMLHRGDAFERRVLDVRGGELATPAFLARSPFGKMPVLETSDGPIWESTSILEWLEERRRVLLPAGEERIARHWDRVGDLYLSDPQSELWFRPDGPLAQDAPRIVETAWRLYDERLAGRDFTCDAGFGLGDLSGAIATHYLTLLGHVPPARVRAWQARCFELPAMATAWEEAREAATRMLAARASSRRP
ncbi:MAG: glutathione S-transferase family protein [Myxococcota bacterium]